MWKRVNSLTWQEFYRDGWLGVWDSLKSVWRKEPRFMVAKPVTISFWVKAEVPADNLAIFVNGMQVESEEKPKIENPSIIPRYAPMVKP